MSKRAITSLKKERKIQHEAIENRINLAWKLQMLCNSCERISNSLQNSFHFNIGIIRQKSTLFDYRILSQDGRVKEESSQRALDVAICLKIKEHVESLDIKTVHYGDSWKHYLDAKLDVTT